MEFFGTAVERGTIIKVTEAGARVASHDRPGYVTMPLMPMFRKTMEVGWPVFFLEYENGNGLVISHQDPEVTRDEAGEGIPGPAGKSAYEVWLEAGNSGTVEDYLESLRGPEGPAGSAATVTKSAVEAVLTGDIGTHHHNTQGDTRYLKNSGDTIANDLTTTTAGKVLDARQGKVLNEKILNLANDNLLSNPEFLINQRGVSSISLTTAYWKYFVDRWRLSGGNASYTQLVPNYDYLFAQTGINDIVLLQVIVDIGATVHVQQIIEDIYWGNYMDSNMVASCWINSAQASSIYFQDVLYNLPQYGWNFISQKKQETDSAFRLWLTTPGTYNIALPKVEYGTIPTRFTRRNPALELAACQRYYENSWYPLATSAENEYLAQIWSSNQADIRVEFKTQKRAVPVVTITPEGAATNVRYYATNGAYYTASDVTTIGRGTCKGAIVRITKAADDLTTWTPGQCIQARFHWAAEAEIF